MDAAFSTLHQVAPWRRDVGWKVVLTEGFIAIAIGLAILLQPDYARSTIRQLLGAVLLLTSALVAGAGFLAFLGGGRADASLPFRLFGGGVGVTLGLLVVLEPYAQSVGGQVGRYLLTGGPPGLRRIRSTWGHRGVPRHGAFDWAPCSTVGFTRVSGCCSFSIRNWRSSASNGTGRWPWRLGWP